MPRRRKQGDFVFPTGGQNGLCAAVAAAMTADYRVNRFAFSGFPGVTVNPCGSGAQIWIAVDQHRAGPLFLEGSVAAALAQEFIAHGTYSTAFYCQIQRLLVELEMGMCRATIAAEPGAASETVGA